MLVGTKAAAAAAVSGGASEAASERANGEVKPQQTTTSDVIYSHDIVEVIVGCERINRVNASVIDKISSP